MMKTKENTMSVPTYAKSIHIDALDFENTAKAVFVMNPSVRERYDDWQELRSFMDLMAHSYMGPSNSFSTSGFNLTAYDSEDGTRRMVRASVSAFTALSYLRENNLQEAA